MASNYGRSSDFIKYIHQMIDTEEQDNNQLINNPLHEQPLQQELSKYFMLSNGELTVIPKSYPPAVKDFLTNLEYTISYLQEALAAQDLESVNRYLTAIVFGVQILNRYFEEGRSDNFLVYCSEWYDDNVGDNIDFDDLMIDAINLTSINLSLEEKDWKDGELETIVLILAKNGQEQALNNLSEYLIEEQCFLDTDASFGDQKITPLHLSIQSNNPEITETLIELGFSLKQQDSSGKTPLDYYDDLPSMEKGSMSQVMSKYLSNNSASIHKKKKR